MKVELDNNSDNHHHIGSYSAGTVVISEQHYNTSLIVSPDRIITDWEPVSYRDLDAAHLDTVVSLQPEIVVIGTGSVLRFPSTDVLQPLLEREIGYEIMDTGAACRSYNILVSEGRWVIAALMMIESEATGD